MSIWARVLGWFLVVFLNLFFVYFSLLRAMMRSQAWQNQYVTACISQLVIEIVLIESATTAWVHWVIPRLICGDVNAVMNSLRKIVNTSLDEAVEWRHPIDTTEHFFVSKVLAKKYPHLLESTIALSFHSYLPPGRMSSRWSKKVLLGIGRQNVNITPTTVPTLESHGIQVYPNPTDGKFIIDFGNAESRLLRISDMLGKEIMIKEVYNATEQIDLEDLSSGIYMIKVEEESGTYTGMIVVK